MQRTNLNGLTLENNPGPAQVGAPPKFQNTNLINMQKTPLLKFSQCQRTPQWINIADYFSPT